MTPHLAHYHVRSYCFNVSYLKNVAVFCSEVALNGLKLLSVIQESHYTGKKVKWEKMSK